MKRVIKFKCMGKDFKVIINPIESYSNYNMFANVKDWNNKLLFGATFKETDPDSSIIRWAEEVIINNNLLKE